MKEFLLMLSANALYVVLMIKCYHFELYSLVSSASLKARILFKVLRIQGEFNLSSSTVKSHP